MNALAFLISFALFVGGLWVMGAAFGVPGYELPVFLGGILMSTLGIFIPFQVIQRAKM
jgi:hypothetical protein